MDKINSRALSKTAVIKYDIQTTMYMVKYINQDQISPMESLKKEVESIITVILNTPSLEQWSEDIDSIITLVLLLLDRRMKHLELNTGTVGLVHNSGTSEIAVL